MNILALSNNEIELNEYTPQSCSQICLAPEEELLKAILNNEASKIKNILEKHPGLRDHYYDNPFFKTTLLIACSNDNINANTVEALLDMGANKKETDLQRWTALHCAARKTDYGILKALLEKDSEDIINIPSDGLNALHVLIRYGKAQSDDFPECAKLLIKKGINLDYGDKQNRTPLDWAMKKEQYEIIDIINAALNSSERNSPLSEKDILINYLNGNNEIDFIAKFNSAVDKKKLANETDLESTLLQICCDKGLQRAATHLLDEGADINGTCANKTKPIELAASHGFTEILKILLKKKAIVTTKAICICLRGIGSTTHDFKGCYHELMKNIIKTKSTDQQLLLLNEKDRNYTPLHYAVRHADSTIVQELLSLGASLGTNTGGFMPIEELQPKILEKHLDNCIKFKKEDKTYDKEYFKVTFDYRSLIPPYIKPPANSIETDDELLKKELIEEGKSEKEKILVKETEVVFYMSNSAEFKHLLKHPVIASFLYMKWRRIQFLFWINFGFYATFFISLILYIFADYAYLSTTDRSAFIKYILQIFYNILLVTLTLLFLRELFQIIMAPKKYVKNFENYIEIILIVINSIVVFCHCSYDTRKQLSSVAILLAAFELVLILGQHPYFSTNVVMLKTVSLNFFKFLGLYSILLIAFALSFYLLFTPSQINREKANTINVVNKENESAESEKKDAFFDNLYMSFFKTIIMLTGEFDASSINFNIFPITSKIVFTLFIFMIAIILLNLLNGLAVSDTQMIKNDAELVGYITRAKHLHYVESMLFGNISRVNLLKKLTNLCCCWPSTEISHRIRSRFIVENACLFPKYLNYKLVLYPNRHGCVELNSKNQNKSTKCFSCSEVFLDKDTVRRTQDIIQAPKEDGGNDLVKMFEEITTLKEKLDSISYTLNNLKP